ARNLLNQMSANLAAACGATGFFAARAVTPWLQPGGTLGATSFYDTGDLKRTLERLVDFDRLNSGTTRFSAGAVNVRTGNFVYFDTNTHKIAPEHVMASGALPPGFPAVEIDGEAPAVGDREQPPSRGYARIPGRSLERARCAAAQSGGSRHSSQRDSV